MRKTMNKDTMGWDERKERKRGTNIAYFVGRMSQQNRRRKESNEIMILDRSYISTYSKPLLRKKNIQKEEIDTHK